MRNPVSSHERQAKTAKKVDATKRQNQGKKTSATTKKNVTKSAHPKYDVMIANAIIQNKQRSGSSLVAITKYIVENYKIPEDKLKSHLRLALKRAVTEGKLRKNKASYKIANRAALLPTPKKQAKKISATKSNTSQKETKMSNKGPKPKTTKKVSSEKPKTTTASRTSPAKKSSPKRKTAQATGSPKKTIVKKTATKKTAKPNIKGKAGSQNVNKTASPSKRGRKPKATTASSPKKSTS